MERLIEKARGVLDVFEPHLGRIEITGSNGRIERVYFEIRQQHIDQWEAPQIKESKRSFLHAVVGESGDKEKLECFVAAFNRFLEITHLAFIGHIFAAIFHCIRPSQISASWSALRQMSMPDIMLTILGLIVGLLICVGRFTSHIIHLCWYIIVALATDISQKKPPTHRTSAVRALIPWAGDRSTYTRMPATGTMQQHHHYHPSEMDKVSCMCPLSVVLRP
ncbi:unnamed protein product [Trichobilharzia regenti]|nr:unnamed protein product [Trichobilharzia regenti]